jgi:hypothetical protein
MVLFCWSCFNLFQLVSAYSLSRNTIESAETCRFSYLPNRPYTGADRANDISALPTSRKERANAPCAKPHVHVYVHNIHCDMHVRQEAHVTLYVHDWSPALWIIYVSWWWPATCAHSSPSCLLHSPPLDYTCSRDVRSGLSKPSITVHPSNGKARSSKLEEGCTCLVDVWTRSVIMVKIWLYSLIFKNFVGTSTPTTLYVASPLHPAILLLR